MDRAGLAGQERLSEIDDLRSQNLISEAEYAGERSRILKEIGTEIKMMNAVGD
jgi:hypothetical protein